MQKFGLKLWSKDFIKNKDFVLDAEKALKTGKFDYLELFALPETYAETKDAVKEHFFGVKTIIHAPHSMQGLDTGNVDEFANNRKRIESSQQFADMLQSDIIILHPGFEKGERFLEESLRQFRAFDDARIAVENMPSYCSQTKRELHGVTPLEIKRFIDETGVKFCFDFSHAICGANSYKSDVYEVLEAFKALNPAMYHLCDGDFESTNDAHLHFGNGNYDLKRLVCDFCSKDAFITMETGSGIPTDVSPWINDIDYIHRLIA